MEYPRTDWDDEELLEEEAETALDSLPSWQPPSYDVDEIAEIAEDDDGDSDDDDTY